MANFTFGQAKALLWPYITSQGPADPVVWNAINFVNEKFINSGEWKGNRFLMKFSVSQDSDGNNYFDTVPGVESVIKVMAIDSTKTYGEIADVMSDWFPWDEGGLGYLPASYVGDTQVIRLGNVPATPLPSGDGSGNYTVDTQRYRVIGQSPETRTMYCLVRRGYVPLVNDSDVLVPSSRNAYLYGVQAFNYEIKDDMQRADVYWAKAFEALNNITKSFQDGEQAEVQIQTKAFSPSLILNLI